MSLWIKICGLREPRTLNTAVEAGVQAIGFVFAESVRQVTPKEASILAKDVPSSIAKVAVFLKPTQNEINRVLDQFEVDLVQADRSALSLLEVPAAVKRLPVVRETDEQDQLPPLFLYEGSKSGRGETVDWNKANQIAQAGNLVLAGGLDPSNVREAINMARPYGVDVSSGVERERGIKSSELIAEFVRQARLSKPPGQIHLAKKSE